MHLEKLHIHDFRKFNDTNINFGKYLTCLSGQNAVGKSTILGILANSSELKKETGATINGNAFKVDLKEIMKFSEKYDESGSNKCTMFFDNIPKDNPEQYADSISFRATWQKEEASKSEKKITKRKRYRLIPMKTKDRNTERKIQWPTLYLGLTRLYPIGEVDDDNVSPDNSTVLTAEEKELLYEKHKEILASSEEYKESKTLKIKNTKKTGFGIQTENYDALANSSGQDNLGQILLSLFSFKRLKEKMGENWNGGLFLIDEVDATLHPVAQNRLIDFLYTFAKENNMQIVFTTHSLTLLEHLADKYSRVHPYFSENMKGSMSIEVNYLTVGHGKLEIFRNPNINEIRLDLLNQYMGSSSDIKVYSEDEEARWFFDKLMSYFEESNLIKYKPNKLSHVSVSLGHKQLLKLLSGDFEYFSRNIILLDGDVKDIDINNELVGKTPINFNYANGKYNILRLPGGTSPERILWEYAYQLPEDHEFYQLPSFGFSFKKQSFVDNGPFSPKYNSINKERDKLKTWFKENKFWIDYLIKFWIDDNYFELLSFLRDIKNAHDYVSKRNLLKEILLDENTIKDMLKQKKSISGQQQITSI